VDGEPERDCSAVLILTHAASAEAAERTRRLKETFLRLKETLLAAQDGLRPAARPAVDIAADPTFTPMTVRPQLQNAGEVQQALQRHYPPLLKDAGIGGAANVWLFINEDGAVTDTRINRSTGYPALDAAALAVAGIMEFTPAYNRDARVPVWVALDIRFEAGSEARDAEILRDFDLHTQQLRQRLEEQERQAERREATRREMDAMRERVATPPAGQPADRALAEGPTFTPMTERPQLTNTREVQQALQRHYPPLLRDAGIGGTVRVWFFIGEDGRVRDTRIGQGSGYDAFDEAALQVASIMEFSPARNRDAYVPVWVSLAITFEVP
jgi:TonB family protein